MASLCTAEDCLNAAAKGGLCWKHLGRRRDGYKGDTKRGAHYATPWERLTEAALGYADADGESEVEYRRACDRLRKAAQDYGQGEAQQAPVVVRRARRRVSVAQLILVLPGV